MTSTPPYDGSLAPPGDLVGSAPQVGLIPVTADVRPQPVDSIVVSSVLGDPLPPAAAAFPMR